jgi:large subunit ribosomal protein L3
MPSGIFFCAQKMNTIFAKKINMTTRYSEAGKRIGATVVSVSPMKISAVLNMDKNGYSAIQIEFGKSKREVRVQEADLLSYKAGDEIVWDEWFKPGDKVRVSGVSKGHGFTGVVKHYKFKGGPRTHGQSDRERARGSSGQTTTPGRVYKGKRMAGRMGNDRVTIKNLSVVTVDPANKQMVLSGPIPGKNTGIVEISKI